MEIAKARFRYTIWFMFLKKVISQGARFFEDTCGTKSHNKAHKNCAPEFLIPSALKLTSCELVVFIDMNAYILIEGRSFKTILKENYAVALNSCYLFIEHEIENDADSAAYGVCIQYTFLKFTAISMNTLQFKQRMNLTMCLVCNIIKLFFIFLWEDKLLMSLDGSR